MLYGDLVNRTLEFHGQQAIPDANFGTDNETKYQRQLRRFFEYCFEAVLNKMNEPWMQRRFELPLAQGISTYDLDESCSIENLVPKSVILLGLGTLGWLRPYHGGYNEWRRIYTDETLVSTAQPTWWFEVPTDAPAVVRTKKIRFDPIPDQAYTVEYQCKINVDSPTKIDDELVFPDEYVYAMQAAGGRLLEWSLKGGVTDGSMYDLAQQAISSVKQVSAGPEERKRGIRMDVRMAGRMPRKGYGTGAVGRQGW